MRWPWQSNPKISRLEEQVAYLKDAIEVTRQPTPGVLAPFKKDLWRQYQGIIGRIPHDDPVTAGQDTKVGIFFRHPWGQYKEMLERDPVIVATLTQRWNNVLSRNRIIQPGRGNKKKAEFAANYVRHVLFERFQSNRGDGGFVQDLRDLLIGVPMGIAFSEIVWGEERFSVDGADGKSTPERSWFNPLYMEARDPRNFGFDKDGNQLYFTQEDTEGEVVEPHKFVIARPYVLYDEPFGTPGLRSLFFYSWYKRLITFFWLDHCERYGEPTVYSEKEEAFRDDEKEALLVVMDDMQNRTAVVPPAGVKLGLLQAACGAENYRELLNYIDTQIQIAIIGQTTTVMGDNNSTGISEVHERVANSIQAMDAEMLVNLVNATIIPWMMEENLPDHPMPKLEIVTDAPKNTEEKVKYYIELGTKTNYGPSIKAMEDDLGIKRAESEEDTLKAVVDPNAQNPSQQPTAKKGQKAEERRKAKPSKDEPKPTP